MGASSFRRTSPINNILKPFFSHPLNPNPMNPLIDHLLHGAELSGAFVVLWKAIRVLNRFESVMKDYPPHRHVGNRILYPRDFSPAKTEHMTAGD